MGVGLGGATNCEAKAKGQHRVARVRSLSPSMPSLVDSSSDEDAPNSLTTLEDSDSDSGDEHPSTSGSLNGASKRGLDPYTRFWFHLCAGRVPTFSQDDCNKSLLDEQ